MTGGKIRTIEEAAALVRDGEHLALSGFACARNATAFSHALIRRGARDLTLSQCVLGLDADLLVGAGAVRRVIYGGGSLDRFGQLQRVNQAIERGAIEFEYLSSLAVAFRYLAGALGLPFKPIKSMLGSDLLARQRAVAPETVRELDDPFTGERLLLLRAMRPDVAVVQAQVADDEGNARIFGPRWETNEAAKAAQMVIVVCEEIVPTETIREMPELTVIPGIRVDAVVPLAWGAHPTSLYRRYDHDAAHLRLYVEASRTQAGFDAYLREYVLDTGTHGRYLERVGGPDRLAGLTADPERGY